MADPTKLIADPRERAARAQEKVRLILRFLRDECWTVTEVAAGVMGVKYPAAHRTLNQMKRDHYLKSEELAIYTRAHEHVEGNGSLGSARLMGRKVVLWGITPHGLAHAWDLDEAMEERASFELGKTHPAYVAHAVSIQRVRLAAEAAGWQSWTPGRFLTGQQLAKVPDGEATDPSGARVAVEYEREIKTSKRYQAILGAYLVALKAGRWQRVDYVCPSRDFAARLQRIFYAIREVMYKGQKAAITHEHLTNRVTFSGLDDWPGAQAVQR